MCNRCAVCARPETWVRSSLSRAHIPRIGCFYDTDWNWRVDAKAGGPSRCMADIGSHWFDMAEHVTGLRVTSLCADLQTFHATRKQPKHSVETFANKLLGPGKTTSKQP